MSWGMNMLDHLLAKHLYDNVPKVVCFVSKSWFLVNILFIHVIVVACPTFLGHITHYRESYRLNGSTKKLSVHKAASPKPYIHTEHKTS